MSEQDPWRPFTAEEKARVLTHLQDIADNICPHCGAPVIEKKQKGPCVYSEPCGHRLYQGKLPKASKR